MLYGRNPLVSPYYMPAPIPTLIQNAIHIVKDDTYLVSAQVHDYVEHIFEEKEPGTDRSLTIAVDGGLEYTRRAGALFDCSEMGLYEEWYLTTDDTFIVIADKLLWGTRGKDGDQPLTYRPIKEFVPDHLQAILNNCPARSKWHDMVVRYWLTRKTEASAVV